MNIGTETKRSQGGPTTHGRPLLEYLWRLAVRDEFLSIRSVGAELGSALSLSLSLSLSRYLFISRADRAYNKTSVLLGLSIHRVSRWFEERPTLLLLLVSSVATSYSSVSPRHSLVSSFGTSSSVLPWLFDRDIWNYSRSWCNDSCEGLFDRNRGKLMNSDMNSDAFRDFNGSLFECRWEILVLFVNLFALEWRATHVFFVPKL